MITYSQIALNKNTGKAEYTEVVLVDSSLTKEMLYSSAREWITVSFKSANHVLQMEDKDAGKLICKGNFKSQGCGAVISKYNDRINFTLIIETKNGKYKYTVTDIEHISGYGERSNGGDIGNEKPVCGYTYLFRGCWKDTKTIANSTICDLIKSLKSYIISKEVESNW